jgi:hypothetical protein
VTERHDILDLLECHQLGLAARGLFLSRLLDEGRREVRMADWSTSTRTLAGIGDPILRVVETGGETVLTELDGVLVQLGLVHGRVYAAAAAALEADAESALRALRDRLPVSDPSSAHEVTVTFWTYSPHGPQPSWRTISVPGWDEIRENYAASSRAGLDALMDGFEPAHGGQLVLWHGRAGTGKTFALRALAWEWRDWCDFHYIVDPDSFFGEHADYLMNVLLQPTYQAMSMRVGIGVAMPDFEEQGDEQEKPWRVLVLEDTGELLTPDAKSVIGQGLSRFLNVVDGLIGQGLRVLVLVTTNEPIRRLHPAVARPGRCAANVEFESLAPAEVSAWLRRHGLDPRVDAPELLASLYARLEGWEAVEAEQTAGFAG